MKAIAKLLKLFPKPAAIMGKIRLNKSRAASRSEKIKEVQTKPKKSLKNQNVSLKNSFHWKPKKGGYSGKHQGPTT